MYVKSNVPVGAGRTDRRRKAILAGKFAAVLLVPLIVIGYPSNPPAGESGANGGSTCGTASCHFHGTTAAAGGVTVTFPSGLTYTPGGPAVPLTVVATAGSGFELSAVVQSSGGQAGSFTAGNLSTVATLGGIQYILQTSTAAAWSFTWTPPATDVGAVTMNIAGISGTQLYANAYTLTAASSGGTTLTVSPNALTFTAPTGGPAPPSQSVQVASSGASIAFTTSTTTTDGGTWLTAATGGTTPMGVAVSVDPTGLAAGTYTGTVAVAAAAASNSPQNVAVTFTVTGGPPPPPSLTLTPTALTFNSTGGSVPAQNVRVASSGAALSFTAAVSTASGGNWLSINPASGTTPATLAVSANVTGLANGTYSGSVTFTSSGAANSPQTLGVTLTVGTTPPPKVPPLTFNFHTRSRQTNGNERVLVSGNGSVNAGGQLTGSGDFTVYTKGGDGEDGTVATGTWSAVSVTSFTPTPGDGGGGDGDAGKGDTDGGVLVIAIKLSPMGGPTQSGSTTIANTGSQRGVWLSITGGPSFVPTGTGFVTVRIKGGGDDGGGGGDDN